MKFIVQKVPSRDVTHLRAEIPDLIIVEDQSRQPMQTFIASMEAAGDEAHVHLEDDIDLCPNFLQKIQKAIESHPRHMISFFTMKKISKPEVRNGRDFCMLQCVYFPAGMAKEIVEFRKSGWDRELQHPDAFDYMIADYLAKYGKHYLLWYPSLVQHQVGVSTLDKRRSRFRQSKIFDGGSNGKGNS